MKVVNETGADAGVTVFAEETPRPWLSLCDDVVGEEVVGEARKNPLPFSV
jgi:hypothetical protein